MGFIKLKKPELPVELKTVLNLAAVNEFLNFMKASSPCT